MTEADIEKPEYLRSHGLLFPKNRDVLPFRVRRALRRNGYELKETEAALRTVKAGDRVMELGAGIGYMSTLVAKKRKVDCVHAFEANPNLISYIKSVHEANEVQNATVHNAIIGQTDGRAKFYVRKNFLASSLSETDSGGVVSVEEIEVRAAEKVMADIQPTVLIADIEGAEVDVIPMLDLSTVRAAIIELHPQWIGPEGVSKVFAAFMQAGLAYYARASHAKVVTFRRSW